MKMRSKKMIIRSSISGGGKSRSSMADAVNIASDKIYDWQKKEWKATGDEAERARLGEQINSINNQFLNIF